MTGGEATAACLLLHHLADRRLRGGNGLAAYSSSFAKAATNNVCLQGR